ncbi:polyphosphate kinase, partial [bacterium]|nr:polyphosphate kinase [bacterium]
GARIVKIFMHITQEEQLNRFRERLTNPFKRWKLTEEDLRNRAHWADYEAAFEDMFAKTATETAPWRVVPANSKWSARLRVLEIVIDALKADLLITPPPIDIRLAEAAAETLGIHVAASGAENA